MEKACTSGTSPAAYSTRRAGRGNGWAERSSPRLAPTLLTGSVESVAMCDEIIGWIKRHLEPLEIDEEAIPLDLIDQVGPDGQFLDTDHTMRHYREDWYPRFIDRHSYADWEALGRPTMRQKIKERVLEILDAPAQIVVPEEVAERVRAIRRRAEARS